MKQTLSIDLTYETLVLAEDITYSRVGDWYDATWQELKLDIICPKFREGHASQPCIVWICGGAFITERKDVWLPEMVDFARMGYTVACVDYRTSDKAGFPAALIDIKTAIRFLKAHAADFCIDPARIFTMGESAGGTLASLAGVTAGSPEWEQGEWQDQDSTVAGVVDFYGLEDVEAVAGLTAENVPGWQMTAFLGDDPVKNMKLASSVNHVTADTCPFIIFHGSADATVPVAQSESLYKRLTDAGVRADLYIVEGAIHGDPLLYQPEVKSIIDRFLREC